MEPHIVTEIKDNRFDKYLSHLLGKSRSLIQKYIEEGCFLVNGKIGVASLKLKEGDRIEQVKDFLEEDKDILPQKIPLDIVFENQNVLVVNKPSGMVVHPGNGVYQNTLVNALLYYTQNLSDINGRIRPGIVHRIDKDTSGLLLIAKNNEAHAILAKDFQDKKVKRKYVALLKGNLAHNVVTIDAPIGRDEKNRIKMAVTDKNSKKAITHITVLKRYAHYTLVECVLETGRTHQIRVHCAYIGHPVFNDPVYDKEEIAGFGQFLHSSELTFTEPITKEVLSFQVPLPKPFQDFLNQLEKKSNE